MSAELLVANHLRLAREALRDAARLLQDKSRNAAYLAQQGVEHTVLALAQSESVHIPRTKQHQLDAMIDELPDANTFKSGLRELSWLEAYATSYRYPRTKGRTGSAAQP